MRLVSIAAVAVTSLVASTQIGAAADLPRKAPPPVAPVAAPTWTGFYIGLNAGGAWGNSDPLTSTIFLPNGYFATSSIPAVNAAGVQSLNPAGFTGGIQLGYNWQWSNLVAGIEGDFEYLGLKGSSSGSGVYPCCAPSTFTIASSVKTDWLATIRGRLGWAAGNWLIYATGGVAFAEVKADWSFSDNCGSVVGCNGPGNPNAFESASASTTKTGWTVGGGVEAKFWERWSWKAEYLYIDLGSVTASGAIGAPVTTAFGIQPHPLTHSADLKVNVVRGGLNYHF